MYKKSRGAHNKTRGENMSKDKHTPELHELRDQPVPPVKGRVTGQADALPRPDGQMSARRPDQYDAVRYELWQYPI